MGPYKALMGQWASQPLWAQRAISRDYGPYGPMGQTCPALAHLKGRTVVFGPSTGQYWLGQPMGWLGQPMGWPSHPMAQMAQNGPVLAYLQARDRVFGPVLYSTGWASP